MGRLNFVALGTFTLGAIFMIVAMMVSWGGTGETGFFEIHYGMYDGAILADEEVMAKQEYSNPDMDDEDGVGLARAAGILVLVGAIVAGIAFVLLENFLLVGKSFLLGGGAGAAGLAALLNLVGLILLPIGINEMAGETVTWHFGLYAGILATAFMLGGAIIAAISILKTTGFKLELADATPTTNFD